MRGKMSYSELAQDVLERVIRAARDAAIAELPDGYKPYGDFAFSIGVSEQCFPYKFTHAHIVTMLMAKETEMVFPPQSDTQKKEEGRTNERELRRILGETDEEIDQIFDERDGIKKPSTARVFGPSRTDKFVRFWNAFTCARKTRPG